MKLNTSKYGKGLKILTPKQMLQRLSIVLAQVMEYAESLILCIGQNKFLKKYITL